jgi:GNAT superfamily N-acetyltransferase
MHPIVQIQPIELPAPGIAELHEEAHRQGYAFIDTLVEEWASGENRFSAPGEALYGAVASGSLIAVGGLTIDPFVNDPYVGRIRRVYVRSEWRNRGIGKALMLALIDHARGHFATVRLRAENADAGRLYERLGFMPLPEGTNATHVLRLTGK